MQIHQSVTTLLHHLPSIKRFEFPLLEGGVTSLCLFNPWQVCVRIRGLIKLTREERLTFIELLCHVK